MIVLELGKEWGRTSDLNFDTDFDGHGGLLRKMRVSTKEAY